MPILAFRSGHHDAAAAAFDDYRLIAPVEEDRLRREKEFWWRSHTMARHRAVLHIAGWTRRDIDVIAQVRGGYPAYYLRFWLFH